MAKIDDLTRQVGGARLRRELETAVAELKKRTRFGLVYESHLPEMTALPGLPVMEGAFVVRREKLSVRHALKVCALADGVATLQPLAGGPEQCVPMGELMALQRFGEPIYPGLEVVGRKERAGANKSCGDQWGELSRGTLAFARVRGASGLPLPRPAVQHRRAGLDV